jgi:integrase/recombinase XerD
MRKETIEYYNHKIQDIFKNEVGKNDVRIRSNQVKGNLTVRQVLVLKKWYDYLITGTKSSSVYTFYAYLSNLRIFALKAGKDFEDIKKEDIDGFIRNLTLANSKSVNAYKLVIRFFFKWYCYDIGESDCPKETPKIVKHIVLKKKKHENIDFDKVIYLEDVKIMLKYAKTPQEKAIMITLFESGCRASEFLDMDVKDLIFDDIGAQIKVDGKTGKRVIRLVMAVPYLLAHINHYPGKIEDKMPLFYSQSNVSWGNRLSRNGLRGILELAGNRFKINKKLNPHWWRHSAITFWFMQGMNEVEVRYRAGWSKESSMVRIYCHMGEKEANDRYAVVMGYDMPVEKQVNAKVLQPLVCPRCEKVNPADARYCNCGQLLRYTELNRESNKFVGEIETVAKTFNVGNTKEKLWEMIEGNPLLLNKLKDIFDKYEEEIKIKIKGVK